MNILLVEDDKDLRKSMKILLAGEGYHVITAESGEQAIACMDDSIRLVILDVTLPGMSGVEVCKIIRQSSNVPVLFLTAKAVYEDKKEGYTAGGDDYIVKPFKFEDLLLSMKALIRRYTVYKGSDHLENNNIIQYRKFLTYQDEPIVMIGEKKVKLTNTEHKILKLLMSNPGRTYSLAEIHGSLWNEPFLKQYRSSIVVHIRNLRSKVDPEGEYIQTVWGRGYRFQENEK